MGLRATPHPPDMLDRQPHGAMLATRSLRSKRIVPLWETSLTWMEMRFTRQMSIAHEQREHIYVHL